MTQYATDFSEYTTGQAPSDWTKRFAANFTWSVESDTSATGGKLIQGFSESSNDRNGLSWDVIDNDSNRADVEIFMRVRFPGAIDAAEILAMARGSGSTSNANTYRHGPRPVFNNIESNKYVNGSFGTIDQQSFNFSSGVFYNVLVQVIGTSQRVKAWQVGNSEPTFNSQSGIDGTDTDISGVGWVGLFRFRVQPVDIDFFGAGTGTDSAPRSVTVSTPTLSNATATPDGSSGYTGTVDTNTGSGTLYHVVTQSTTTPSVAQIKAGEDDTGAAADASGSQTIGSTGTKSVAGSSLTTGTTYYIHYSHTDGSEDSSPVTSSSFTPQASIAVPTNLSVSNITSTSATLDWTAGT